MCKINKIYRDRTLQSTNLNAQTSGNLKLFAAFYTKYIAAFLHSKTNIIKGIFVKAQYTFSKITNK